METNVLVDVFTGLAMLYVVVATLYGMYLTKQFGMSTFDIFKKSRSMHRKAKFLAVSTALTLAYLFVIMEFYYSKIEG